MKQKNKGLVRDEELRPEGSTRVCGEEEEGEGVSDSTRNHHQTLQFNDFYGDKTKRADADRSLQTLDTLRKTEIFLDEI